MKASEFTTSNSSNEEDTVGFYGKCEVVEGDVKCACDEIFCDPCLHGHIEPAKIQVVTLGSNFTALIFCQVSFCQCKISGLELVFSVADLDFRAVD